MEFDVFVPAKPLFYERYVDDTYVRRKKNIRDMFFEDLNSHYQNIKSTVEVNPSMFLDTELIRAKESILTEVFNKPHKFSVNWSFKIPIRYKCNALIGELQREKRIASNFDKKYGELKKNIKMLVFHQIFLMRLSYLNGCLRKEKYLLWDFHTHLRTKKLASYLSIKQKIILMVNLN